jgi:hypothetical protein
MTKNNQPIINLDLFLSNIHNLPAIITAFKLLEINYISRDDYYQVIHEANIKFQNSLRKILNGLEDIFEHQTKKLPNLDYEEIFKVRKIIDSFDLSAFELLKITKEKLDQLVDFIALIEKNFSNFNLSSNDIKKINQEITIIKYELLN